MSFLVSVLIPCYNSERFLEASLNSVINQTYSNLEILCFDDGSTDKTLEILHHFESIDNRIKIFDRGNDFMPGFNKGVGYTLNDLISVASGTFYMRHDDDISVPDRLASNLNIFFCTILMYRLLLCLLVMIIVNSL